MVPHHDAHVPAAGEILGEGARAESSERYSSMFTHHPHAAYSVDTRGYFTDANDRALEMTGLSLEEMRQTHFAQVIHPEDLHLIQDGFDRAMAGDPQLVEARVVRVDGEVVDIRCTAIPVIVADEVVGVHGVTEDVTEAKRVLRELEEANAAKTLFLATVSHEVRTPLAALVGASELLIDTDLPPEPEHFARIVHRSGERLMHLVQEILEFSGLEARQTVLRRLPVDVRAIIDDVASWAVPLAESQGLTLTLAVDDGVPDDRSRRRPAHHPGRHQPGPERHRLHRARLGRRARQRPPLLGGRSGRRQLGGRSGSATPASGSRTRTSARSSSRSSRPTRSPRATASGSGSAWRSAASWST